jgi:glycosyltransferase involved in cell wall biosynthesis
MKRQPTITVITATRDRSTLERCVRSVAEQDYPGVIEHLLLLDDIDLSEQQAARLRSEGRGIRICRLDTSHYGEEYEWFYSVSRIGWMRNRGIEACQSDYIAYLDDDNTLEPHHLSSLAHLLEKDPDIGIAYSWRRLWYADGSPYCEAAYPWTPYARLALDVSALSHAIYSHLVKVGIRIPDDNLQRDAVLASDGTPVFTVDTSEMMVRRSVHETQRWVTHFAWREMVGDYSDDYAFVKNCFEAGVRFACSRLATLNYFLSGVSNRISQIQGGVACMSTSSFEPSSS